MPTSIPTGTSVVTDKPADKSTAAESLTDKSPNTQNSPSKREQPTKESLREQKKAKARDLILNCAQQLINTEGYSATKMRDVAAAAGMSYQTLYNYFPTKGLILQELLTKDLVKLQRSTFDTLNGTEPLLTKLREFAKVYIDAVAPDERHLWKEVCAELLKATSHHTSFVALLDDRALTKLQNALSSAQANHQLDPHIDCDTLAAVLYSLLDAMLIRYLLNESLSKPNILSALSAHIRLTVTPYVKSP